jgi:hypothetical protein
LSNLIVGDKVQYKAEFLRSICAYTGSLPFAKGTIKEITKYSKNFTLATIDWQDEDVPNSVNIENLESRSGVKKT